jgi:hypothetical protein
MIAEFFRGPWDGATQVVEDQQVVIIVTQPPMTPHEFMAMDMRPELASKELVPLEHAYVLDRSNLSAGGNHRFVYAGVRAKK